MAENHEEHKIRDEVKSFLIDRRARNCSPGTLDFYTYYLDTFTKFCTDSGAATIEQVTPNLMRLVLDAFGADHTAGGVSCLYRATRTFLLWYEEETDGAWRSPTHKVKAPKVRYDPIPGLSVEDLQRLLSTCGRDWFGKRDRALLLFLFDTGLRRKELIALNLEDIDIDSGTVRVKHGKGDKPRVVYFGAETATALRRYLRGQRQATDSPLWLDRDRSRLAYTGLRDMLTRRSKSAGLSEIPSPHDFRRGFALTMLRNGADVLRVSKLLGHEGIEVTRRYLALIDDDLEEAHRQAGPVDGRKRK